MHVAGLDVCFYPNALIHLYLPPAGWLHNSSAQLGCAASKGVLTLR